MNIEQKLVSSVIGGLKALYGQDVPAAQVQLQKTKKEFEGHLTLVVFPFLRMSKKGPEQTAQEIGEYLQANEPSVAAFNVIKGFLNLTIASSAWIELLNGIHADKQYGIVAVTDNSPLVMIEYSSPNTISVLLPCQHGLADMNSTVIDNICLYYLITVGSHYISQRIS